MKKKIKYNNKLLTWLYIIILAVLILFLFFNKYGVVKYIGLKSEINSIEKEIEQNKKEIEKLNKEINSLKNDDKKLEEVAREKFHMKKRNEKAFRFKDKKEK